MADNLHSSFSSLSTHSSMASLNQCVHTLTQEENSVWDLEHFQLKANLKGHLGSILSLHLRADGKWLFSSSGDGTVRVWDTETFQCLYHIHSSQDVGDVFSVVYSEALNTMFIGCQNTSIQWMDFSDFKTDTPVSPSITHTLRRQGPPSFFDGGAGNQIKKQLLTASMSNSLQPLPVLSKDDIRCSIPEENIQQNSHFGYVYCLLLGKVPNVEEEILFSASGEGDIKLWKLRKGQPIELWRTLRAGADCSALTLALFDGLLYCGTQGGIIKIFDLETFQLIRSIAAHTDDVLALVVRGSQVYSASADGVVKQWNRAFDLVKAWDDHQGSVLSMTCSKDYVITGASDKLIKLWAVPTRDLGSDASGQDESVAKLPDSMHRALSEWIAIPTVSGVPSRHEDCRRGAKFLKDTLLQLGAEAKLIPGAPGHNPIVYGQFSARPKNSGDEGGGQGPSSSSEETQDEGEATTGKRPMNVLVYGHYDVIAAESKKWVHPPFVMQGENGYLYGRGTTDNKGPMLACIFAASELMEEQALDVNVKFLIEGEEENGSIGFFQAVEQNIELFKEADVILLSNSYWLGEDIPCLTYGLRGVIHSTLTITSKNADLHAGVDGGAVSEPLFDMVKVLAELVDPNRNVKIPGFYDCVRPLTAQEDALYTPIVEDMLNNPAGQRHWDRLGPGLTKDEVKQNLMARWRHPSLTVHQVDVSGPKNRTVLPRMAKASVSMRIVPDQDSTEITRSFEAYVQEVFGALKSENEIDIAIKVVADWWVGDTENRFFKAAEVAIERTWGQKPLFIREGGSVPAIRWLEKRLQAAAVHIPMGQSSDQAHLNDERIRVQNLSFGKRVVKEFLKELK
ncbi:hypothetical protein BGZ73_004771 [Actinomortierella ambigua]|nr:hypothetical protein BGZ73_004771 [Actinomortierella ambigua]